ncbi:MAG: 2Fe-2S iron-sulfur cluster-binding protein [Rubrivivax sp.]
MELLRDRLGLTGTHVGCDTACGACTEFVDGRAVKSTSSPCRQRPHGDDDRGPGVTASGGGALHPVQEAFVACHGLQCGYCTPGMVMSAVAPLRRTCGRRARSSMRSKATVLLHRPSISSLLCSRRSLRCKEA